MKTIERSCAFEEALCLSAHEMATLFLLCHAPIESRMETPDVVALQKAGLAELVESEPGEFRFAITRQGNAGSISTRKHPMSSSVTAVLRRAPPEERSRSKPGRFPFSSSSRLTRFATLVSSP